MDLEDRIEDLEDYVAILENRLEPEDKISHEEVKGVLQEGRVSN